VVDGRPARHRHLELFCVAGPRVRQVRFVGANAEGYSVFPRLAGRHSEYLVRQMRMQRVGLHESQIHTRVLGQLNDAQIDALAAYLSSR
jgi:hypothetical protein